MLGHADRLLASGGVGDEENFLRLEEVAQALQFLHERLVDLLPAGRVVDLHVRAGLFRRPRRRLAADLHEVRRTRRRRGLTRAVEADHHHAAGLVELEGLSVAAEDRGQFVVENFDDLLAWGHAAEHVRAERFLLHPGDEGLRHLKMHVRLQERQAHLPHGVGDVAFADGPVATQVLEDVLELVAELGKHGRTV